MAETCESVIFNPISVNGQYLSYGLEHCLWEIFTICRIYRTEEKNVLLTLMDLARLASRFGLCELPELVRMEKEIEALEAAAAASTANGGTQTSTTTGTMTSCSPKVDISVYAARLADRKASGSSPERSPSSISSDLEVASCTSSICSGVNSDPVARYCSNASFTTTEVLLIDLEDEEKSSEVGTKIDLSTLVIMTNSAGDSSCQTNTNNTENVSSCTNTENNPNDNTSISVGTDSNLNVTDGSVMASLPPRKHQQVSTPKARPRATVSKLPVHHSRVAGNGSAINRTKKVEVAKRSTSVTDLRELSKTRVKRRNIRQDKGNLVSNNDPSTILFIFTPSRSYQPVTKICGSSNNDIKNPSSNHQNISASIKDKIGAKEHTLLSSLDKVRSPLTDHDQITPIPKPLSTSSTSSKHSSSGFVSHASSCSDLAAENPGFKLSFYCQNVLSRPSSPNVNSMPSWLYFVQQMYIEFF
ncbi:hypothetical protein ACTXT7_002105 [Hymenolepis weldensis]